MQKILLIEDEKMLIEVYRAVFEQAGFEVLVESESAEAFALAQKEKPKLILLDLIFPDKSNGKSEASKASGFNFLAKLKATDLTENIPVIVLTNLGSEADEARARKSGAVDFMVKSKFLPSEVLTRAKQWIK